MKKSQLSRIILSFIVVITMFLTSDSTNLIIDATEDASLQDLSSYELIAENVIDDTSIAGKTFDLYCYDFKPMASLFVLNSSEEFRNGIALWEATTLAFKPEDIPKRAIEAKGYYMTVILSILKSNYQSDSIINQLTDFTESSEEISSLYNDFIKLYKETKNIDLIEKINSNSGLTDEHKESLKEVVPKFLDDKKLVVLGDSIDNIFFVLEQASDIQEYLDRFISYCQVSQLSSEWRQCIQNMYDYCDKSNTALVSALETLIECSDGWNNAGFELWNEIVSEKKGDAFSDITGHFIDKIVDGFPLIKGMRIGAAIGEDISNMLFSTDKITEKYYIMDVYYEVLGLIKKSVGISEVEYLNNKNASTAKTFVSHIDILFTALQIGNDFGKDYADTVYKGGILNPLFSSKTEYENVCEKYEFFKEYIADAHKRVLNYWILDLYDTDLALYEAYASYFDIEYIDVFVSRVEFENDSVEWGTNDIEFYGLDYDVYPENAANKSVSYSSSDDNVVSINKWGDLNVKKAGKCQIIITSDDNTDIYDVIEVEVIEGHGRDGLKEEEIIPIISFNPEISNPEETYGFKYLISDSAVTITGYTGEYPNIVIPDTIEGYPVTAIDDYAFRNCTQLTNIVIPETVTTIGGSAFYGCTNLNSVNIPDGVTAIESYTFYSCSSLTKVSIPDSVEIINSAAFENCSQLLEIAIPDSVTEIEYNAFYNCSNATIYSPVDCNVTLQNNYALYSYNSVSKTAFLKDVKSSVTSFDIKDNVMGCTVTAIGKDAFSCCDKLYNVSIPDSIVSIESNAFYRCESLTKIKIPDSVTVIGEYAFAYCENLTDIVIPYGVTSIEGYTFKGCSRLTNITIPDSIATIKYYAFENCSSLTEFFIPDSVTEIRYHAFYDCTNATIYYPVNCNVEDAPFYNNYAAYSYDLISKTAVLTNVGGYVTDFVIPKSVVGCTVTTIGEEAFNKCEKLIEIKIPDNITSIKDSAFSDCVCLTKAVISDSVVDIGNYAFINCSSLTDIAIPENITEIKEGTFAQCASLKNVRIPNKVTSIGQYAFNLCTSASICLPENCKSWAISSGHPSFSGCVAVYTYNEAKKECTLLNVSNEITEFVIPENIMGYTVVAIEDSTFDSHYQLTSITIPDSVESIGEEAFLYCENLSSITIGNGVKKIESDIIWGTEYYNNTHNWENGVLYIGEYLISAEFDVTQLSIKEGTITIADEACQSCNFEDVIIPDSVSYIGEKAFFSCSALKSVTVSENVLSIGNMAFSYCESLSSINVETGNLNYKDIDGVLFNKDASKIICYPSGKRNVDYEIPINTTVIEENAFDGSDVLENVIISSGVTTIGNSAFSFSELKSVTFDKSVTTIGDKAFYCCYDLTDVYYAGTEAEWNSISIGSDNESLTNATIHYNSSNTSTPSIDVPAISKAEATSANSATLTWQRVNNATSYRVYRSSSATGAKTLLKAVSTTTFTDKTVEPEKTYYYFVKAYNGTTGVLSDYSDAVLVKTPAAPVAPSKPTNVKALSGGGNATITWDAVSDATSYRVFRSTSLTGARTLEKVRTSTYYIDTNVDTGKTYYYWIVSYNANTGLKSGYSAYSSVKIVDTFAKTIEIKSASVLSTSVTLKWDMIPGATSYRIYRRNDDGTRKLLYAQSMTEYKDTGLTKGKAYIYEIRAYSKTTGALTAYSAKKTVRPMAAPTILTGNVKGKITWDKNAVATSYRVYRADSLTGAKKLLKPVTTTYYTDTTAEKGKTYYYFVAAYDNTTGTLSAYSNAKAIKISK